MPFVAANLVNRSRSSHPTHGNLGYATALAEIWRLHHDGQMVRHILTASGLTLKHLEWGGVEEFDLAAIRDACLGTRSEAQLMDRRAAKT